MSSKWVKAICVVPEPELTTLEVELVGNSASTMDHFDLNLRLLADPSFEPPQSLTPRSTSPTAVATASIAVTPGDYVLRAEAVDAAGGLLGQAREVQVTALAGAAVPVSIVLDLSDFPDDEEESDSLEVSVEGQNGADLTATLWGDPTATGTADITIDTTPDLDGPGSIRTGFASHAAVLHTPKFVDGSTTNASFRLAAGVENVVWAVAVDDHGAGTAHAFHFDPIATPTFVRRETWRVNDVRDMGSSGHNNLLLMSTNTPEVIMLADGTADQIVDQVWGSAGDELLSWGAVTPQGTDRGRYRVRVLDSGGPAIATGQVIFFGPNVGDGSNTITGTE